MVELPAVATHNRRPLKTLKRETTLRTSVALEVEDTDALIAIDFLLDSVNLSKSRLKKLMNAGGVWLRRDEAPRYRLRRAMSDLRVGDVLEVYYDEALLDQPLRPCQCLHDQDIYSVWQKPIGAFAAGSDWGDHNSLERQAELHFHKQRPVWLCNRVPAAARGLVVVSHHRRASAGLQTLWDQGDMQTRWRLLMHGDQGPRLRSADGSASPLMAEAAQAAGLPALVLHRLEYQAATRTTRVEIEGAGLSPEQLLRWAEVLGVSLPAAGELMTATELLAPPEEADESPLELVQLDLIGLQFECPFTGEAHAFRL